MVGEKLHEYDLELCGYVVCNLRQRCDDAGFRACLTDVAPRLASFILEYSNNAEGDRARLTLDNQEFWALQSAFSYVVPELEREWVPYETIHRRHVLAVREIRDALTRQDAEDWSVACAHFARRLSRRRVLLVDGIEIVQEWIWHLRRLLLAMGATHFLPYPEGCFPTPTVPTPLILERWISQEQPVSMEQNANAQRPVLDTHDRESASLLRAMAESLQELRELVISQRQVRDHYSTEQVAERLGKAHWTVREWCRHGRVKADKKFSGRGRSPEWVIPHDELLRIEREGLLPVRKN